MSGLYIVAGAGAILPKGTFVRQYNDEFFIEQYEVKNPKPGEKRWLDKPGAPEIPLAKLQHKVYPLAGVPKPRFVMECGKVVFAHKASDLFLPEDKL